MRHSLAILLLTTGCLDSKVQSDFNVQLVPVTPQGQAPIEQAVELGVVIRGRDTQVITPGAADVEGGSPPGLEATELEPIDDAFIGLVGTDELATLTAATVFSYGEAGPFTLATDNEPMDVSVLVAEAGRVGLLGTLAGDQTALLASVAVSANGDVYTFGGLDNGVPSDGIARLTDLDAGDWSFQRIGTLPGGARVGMTATVVDLNGQEAILVTGGRADPANTLQNANEAFLLTTEDGLTPWDGVSREARSGHTAVPLANGRVLLVGGFTNPDELDASPTATFEVFDPGFQVFNTGASPLPIPPTGFAAADVGAEGVLLCGGHTTDADGNTVPTDVCTWISPLGSVRDAPPLPLPVTGLAMAAVGERHVLATGGIAGTLEDGQTAPATSQVWLYTVASDSWQELDPLASPRAHHRAVPSPDGRIIVVGGVRNTNADGTVFDTPVECTEVYDPVARTIQEGGCQPVGSGLRPAVGAHPSHGAVVFSGDATPGTQFGFIPFPAPF